MKCRGIRNAFPNHLTYSFLPVDRARPKAFILHYRAHCGALTTSTGSPKHVAAFDLRFTASHIAIGEKLLGGKFI